MGDNFPGRRAEGGSVVIAEVCYMFSATCTTEVIGLGATDTYIYIL